MTRSLLLATAALTLAAPALAQSAPLAPTAPRVESVRILGGSDRAGPTTRAEVAGRAREQFAKVDTDRDGVVTREEIGASVQARMTEGRNRAFDMLDTNKDGTLSREEFAARRPIPPRPGGEVERRPGDQVEETETRSADGRQVERRVIVRRLAGGYRQAGGLGMRMLVLADADKDGRVTEKEAVDATLARFDRMDANKDGTLTAEERRASLQAMRERMRGNRDMRPLRAPLAPPAPPLPPRG